MKTAAGRTNERRTRRRKVVLPATWWQSATRPGSLPQDPAVCHASACSAADVDVHLVLTPTHKKQSKSQVCTACIHKYCTPATAAASLNSRHAHPAALAHAAPKGTPAFNSNSQHASPSNTLPPPRPPPSAASPPPPSAPSTPPSMNSIMISIGRQAALHTRGTQLHQHLLHRGPAREQAQFVLYCVQRAEVRAGALRGPSNSGEAPRLRYSSGRRTRQRQNEDPPLCLEHLRTYNPTDVGCRWS